MLYALHELAYQAALPLSGAARIGRAFWGSPLNPLADTNLGRTMFAAADLTRSFVRRYEKPAWGLEQIPADGRMVRVHQESVYRTPWLDLVRFRREDGVARPVVLIVAPLSGHYATLLRGTVRAFIADHDVYVTDWVNAREVSTTEGTFDFYDYVDHVRDVLRHLGGRTHVVAVCQPGPPVLAAAALMAEDGEACRPKSLTFMGSPIDARLAPTVVNSLAAQRPFSWFQNTMISTVPLPHPGFGRRVYPGFVQLFSFMSLNQERHDDAHWRYFQNLVKGDGDAAAKHRAFYDEYLSVLDLTEEFYLQTVDIVFQRHLLAKGELVHRGRRVSLSAITDIGLHTVEGEDDDISGVGQTQAAHALCDKLPAALHELYVQPDVGHYGVFHGKRFESEIYPRLRAFIARS